MITQAIVTGGPIPAQSGVALIARILGQQGQPITQASLSSITYTVNDLTSGAIVAANVPLSIAGTVFNSLVQADPRWTKDSVASPGPDGLSGYNFLATIPATSFPTEGDRMEVRVTFTPLIGQPFVQVFRFTLV